MTYTFAGVLPFALNFHNNFPKEIRKKIKNFELNNRV